MNNPFDWNRMRAFLATADKGSLTAAARPLGLTQPTLSRQISALEEELGLMLFERVGRGLVLTAAGQEMQRLCRKVFAPWASWPCYARRMPPILKVSG